MKRVLISILLIAVCYILNSQTVEVQGKLKVSDMQTENTDELLVTRKDDGTLGTRQASSILPPVDTTRTFERDIQLAKQICDCPSLPSFLVESALENGYTAADLLDAGVPVANLVVGGVDPLFLFDNGISPIELVSNGASADLFIGLTYQDGIIFYIDPLLSYGLVVYPQFIQQPVFGCDGLAIAGLQTAIGTGANNTNILMGCPDPVDFPSCANFATDNVGPGQFFESEYSDWYIPSIDAVIEVINKLKVTAPSLIETGTPYYSSSVDYSSTTSMCSTGLLSSSAGNAMIVDNVRTSPQFKTIVIRSIF